MRAAVTSGPGSVGLEELPEPVLGQDEVLVRVEAVGLCGSDFHFFQGSDPYASYPRVQGHEFSGTVVGVPSGGNGRPGPAAGDLVAVEPLLPCGTCYPCRRGRPNCCVRLRVIGVHVDGALAEYVAVPRQAAHVANGLAPELAALVEPLSIGVHACRRAMVAAGDRLVVFGAGAIGQAVLVAAVHRGASVLAVDRVGSRLELASRLGAAATVDAARADVEAEVASWTGGDMADVAVEATGVAAVLAQCAAVAAHGGRVLVLGTPADAAVFPALEITRKELDILGSRNNLGCFPEALASARDLRGRLGQLITHRFDLGRIGEALEFGAAHPELTEKIVITVS
jgi:L-gulonate 5-dehydrogenase